ncbi:MAG: hypothetical protein AAB423_04305 [Patescibacteria group bacterium]
MRVLVIYRPVSEHARVVDDFIRDFKRRVHDANFEIIDMDTREGISLLSLYDIPQAPAIIALREDGQMIESWTGQSMPLINDVAYYAHS